MFSRKLQYFLTFCMVLGILVFCSNRALAGDGIDFQVNIVPEEEVPRPPIGGGMPKKPVIKSIIEQIQNKIEEISKKISNLGKQIAQLFKKEPVVEVPERPPEEIVPPQKPSEEIIPPERPPEEIVPPVRELPKEEIISPEEIPSEKKEVKVGPIYLLKEYGKWLWQPVQVLRNKIWLSWIWLSWQKIWPF